MRSSLSRLARDKDHRVRVIEANRASHGPRVRAKVRVKITREHLEENPKDPKVPKAQALTILGFMIAGAMMNGMMAGVLLDGTKVGNKRMTLPQAHFHLEAFILVP